MDRREVFIPADSKEGPVKLGGELQIPKDATGLVVFAHGSGSSRRSPRNQQVAAVLQSHQLATLLFDLLTEDEEAEDAQTAHLRFDIDFLTTRLSSAILWAQSETSVAGLPVGCFGASTGAAAALKAAARPTNQVRAVVSRGGRPDLAGDSLEEVTCPTLLLVGGNDEVVIELNARAFERLSCRKSLELIPGATHLFPEPGALERVAKLAAEWFVGQLRH